MMRWSSAIGMVVLLVAPLAIADGAHTTEGSYTFFITETESPLPDPSTGDNCVTFGQSASNLTGTATATWTAQTPLAERLEIVLVVIEETGPIGIRVTGSSPLTLQVEDVYVPPAPEGFPVTAALAVQLAQTGVVIGQKVTFTFGFHHNGSEPLEPRGPTGCAA